MQTTSSVGSGIGVGNVERPPEEVLSKIIYGVLGGPLADLQKAIRKDRHQVIHQILSDGL